MYRKDGPSRFGDVTLVAASLLVAFFIMRSDDQADPVNMINTIFYGFIIIIIARLFRWLYRGWIT